MVFISLSVKGLIFRSLFLIIPPCSAPKSSEYVNPKPRIDAIKTDSDFDKKA